VWSSSVSIRRNLQACFLHGFLFVCELLGHVFTSIQAILEHRPLNHHQTIFNRFIGTKSACTPLHTDRPQRKIKKQLVFSARETKVFFALKKKTP